LEAQEGVARERSNLAAQQEEIKAKRADLTALVRMQAKRMSSSPNMDWSCANAPFQMLHPILKHCLCMPVSGFKLIWIILRIAGWQAG